LPRDGRSKFWGSIEGGVVSLDELTEGDDRSDCRQTRRHAVSMGATIARANLHLESYQNQNKNRT